jgi:hypothetical protein
MIWTKCLSYLRKHKLTVLVTTAFLIYYVARMAHFEVAVGHFDIVVEPIIEVIIAHFIGEE